MMDIDRLVRKKLRAKRNGNLQQMAEVVKHLGDTYFEEGRLDDALQEYTEQLEICNRLDDKLNSAVAHRMIGEVYTNLGNYEEALIHHNYHLEGATEMKNLLEEQRAFATLGRTYFCLAESLTEEAEKRKEALGNARTLYMKSISLCDKLEKTDIEFIEITTMRARLFLNVGLVLEAEKDHSQAINLVEKAATLCKTYNLKEDYHRTQLALTTIYERQGNFELALKHVEIATQVDDLALKAEAQFVKAELLLRMEKWTESRKMLVHLYLISGLPESLKYQIEKSLRIVATLHRTEKALDEEESVRGKSKLYETLGDAAVAAQCFEKAIDYYRNMLLCAKESGSDQTGAALISLAQTLKDVGRYGEALDFARRELKLCTNPREICRSALFLADLLTNTKASDKEIRETYDLALNNAQLSEDFSLQILVMRDLFDYLKKSENVEEARVLEEKLNELEKTVTLAESDNESENNDIGKDICLDDLSDVENERRVTENVRVSRKRTNRHGYAIKRNEKGETQLHVACINGNIENVKKLLSAGHCTNVRDHFGWTPLHEAANHGYVEIAELLLDHGANVNDSGGTLCRGVTPLHDAASCGNISLMLLLIKHGADVTLKTTEGDTVLDCLEEWRNRVDDLSTIEQKEYENIRQRLSSILPVRGTKNKKRSSETMMHLTDHTCDDKNISEKLSAGEDYKRTIASLKRRNNPITTSLNSAANVQRNICPLLSSDQVLVEDWLEDDTDENIKVKSSGKHSATAITKRKSTDLPTYERKTKRHKSNTTSQNAEIDLTSDDNNSSDASEMSNSLSDTKAPKRKQQTSLLSIGFTKQCVSRTPSPVDSYWLNSQSNEKNNVTDLITLNIFVDAKVFKLQVDLSIEPQSLIQQILVDSETRFFNETGCTAKLDLRTTNNTIIHSDSILRFLKDENMRNFKCGIIKLDVPSIIERYKIVCKTYETDIHEFVSKCLKSCENTSILRLKQENISKENLLCILRTLEYQRNIQVLHLSGGELCEAGMTLNNCIARLSDLQELYLQECDLDSECLSKLEKLPPQLKLLDLSYNRLGPSSQKILLQLLTPLKYLHTLNLRCCHLGGFRCTLKNTSLVNLDISWNNLDEDDVSYFLQSQLLKLNLSNMCFPSQFNLTSSLLRNAKFSFANLESLELACCGLSDTDIENILPRALNLTRFIINGNRRISAVSANMLLKHRPTLRYIDISGCAIITECPDSKVYIDNPKMCTLVASMMPDICEYWFDLWRGNSIMTKFVYNLIIFKPIAVSNL